MVTSPGRLPVIGPPSSLDAPKIPSVEKPVMVAVLEAGSPSMRSNAICPVVPKSGDVSMTTLKGTARTGATTTKTRIKLARRSLS